MYKYFVLVLLIVLCNCSEEKKEGRSGLSEEQKRKYFVDSFSTAYGFGYYETDSARSFPTFFKKNYPGIRAVNGHDAFPYALEEEYIDTASIQPDRNWFRVIVTKPFQRPYALKVENRYGRNYLTAKITNGDGGYYTGTLAATLTVPLTDSMTGKVFTTLDGIAFWNQPRFIQDSSIYLHPELWVIEAISRGRYHYVVRTLGFMKKNEHFRKLVEQAEEMKKLTRLNEVKETLLDDE